MNKQKRLFYEFLRAQIYAYRKLHSLSQERMAEELHISPRAYFDQEHGKYGFSALALGYFLILLREGEVEAFFRKLQEFLQWLEQNGVA